MSNSNKTTKSQNNVTEQTTTTLKKKTCSEIGNNRIECSEHSCYFNPNTNVCQDKKPTLECPSDTSNLVCRESNGQKSVGMCQDNIFLPYSVCNSKINDICSEFQENPCAPVTTTASKQTTPSFGNKINTPGASESGKLMGASINNKTTQAPTTQAATTQAATTQAATTQAATTQAATTQAATTQAATTQAATTQAATTQAATTQATLPITTQATTNTITSSSVSNSNTVPEASNANPTITSSVAADVPSNNNTTSVMANAVPTTSAIMNNTSTTMTEMANASEMVNYTTQTGLQASNSFQIDEMYKNSKLIDSTETKDGTPLTYYIHEVGENGESRLYEYEYEDIEELEELKQRENAVKAEMESVKDKKLVTDNTGKKYYYNPKTGKLTSYKDGSSVNNQLEDISDRLNALNNKDNEINKINVNVKDKTNTKEVESKMLFPTIDENSIVYLNNNFGNSEHPEATTEVSQKKTGSVNEIKVSKREAKKIIKETQQSEEEAMEELIEETVEEHVEEHVEENPEEIVNKPKRKSGMSLFDKIAIVLFVIVFIGLAVWFLMKKNKTSVSSLNKNTPKFQVVSNYNRVLSKVRHNLN